MEAKETAKPPPSAAPLNVTLQGVVAGVLRVVLVQFKLLNVTGGVGSVIVPPLPLAGMDPPPAVEATTPLI